MGIRIMPEDTPGSLAQNLIGDARLTHELMIPGWSEGHPLPIGQQAYLKDERRGPPTRNWTEPRK